MTNQFFIWNQVQLGIDRANAPKFLKAVLILNLIVVGGTSCSNEDDCGAESSTFSDMEISEVTSSSVNVSGFVTPPPCERLNTGYGTGIVLSTEPDPTLSNGDDYGSSSLRYDLDVEGLSPETTYYIRPYIIINLKRYELGKQYVVTTLP